ncbi:conserved hypothetical protein [Mesorhizobium metallidurans STM 2683]|uniref:Nutrient deprivation-induced protein n=1 Tax=Mesorhizobium metallidurans STM 2683 TaxID=1297569 RepID=M5F1E0_9HYPH|nr:hypothetical protein [Mesorhizobium metallidurans]CCV05631.1 conserved hypothetical protein [Mesorhizobium metallidurans STM 2683]
MTEKTSAELQHDAELVRAQVSETADSIRNKMTPGQLIDEFTGMFTGEGSSSLLTTLRGQVQANPLPVALVGVGLAWLMAGQRTEAEGRSYPSGSSTMPDASEFGRRSANEEADLLSGMKESLTEASSIAGGAADSIAATAAETAHGISDKASGYVSATASQTAKASAAAADMLRQEPLVLAALGVALGTAIGAFLPRTDFENLQLGESSGKLRDQASKLLDQGLEGVKDVAAQAYQTIKDQADEQGLIGDGVDLVDQVKKVVHETGSQTETLAREKLQEVADKLPGSDT